MARVVHELREASPEPNAGARLSATLSSPAPCSTVSSWTRTSCTGLLIAPVIDALVELFARRSGEYLFEVGGRGTRQAPAAASTSRSNAPSSRSRDAPMR
jgi:hypothetical protein